MPTGEVRPRSLTFGLYWPWPRQIHSPRDKNGRPHNEPLPPTRIQCGRVYLIPQLVTQPATKGDRLVPAHILARVVPEFEALLAEFAQLVGRTIALVLLPEFLATSSCRQQSQAASTKHWNWA